MLSRVANNLYWLARYLERAENTARLVNVNSHLLLDLPKNIKLGWEPIVDILSFRDLFYHSYNEADEKSVINFIVLDKQNPGSIINSLFFARENARTVREIIPREAWEQINNLYHEVSDNKAEAFSRGDRYRYLSNIVLAHQTITGLLAGTMTHDEAYSFIRIGRNLERGDMSTRLIDVRSASLLPEVESEFKSFKNIQWMGVLKSMTAYQMYRRGVRVRINREDVLDFLLLESKFPRSLLHTIEQVEKALIELPNNKVPSEKVRQLKNYLINAEPSKLTQEKLHIFIDKLQSGISDVDSAISSSYF